MSADKHRNLQIRVAYLRAASRESGLGLNIKWAAKLTKFLMRMVADGEIALKRQSLGGRKNVTVAYATDTGKARLATCLERFGPDFGDIAQIGRAEPSRLSKTQRRLRRKPPEIRRSEEKRRREARIRSVALFHRRTPERIAS